MSLYEINENNEEKQVIGGVKFNDSYAPLGIKLLWENTNKDGSDFEPQTITLSSDDYDMLLIIVSRRRSDEAPTISQIALKPTIMGQNLTLINVIQASTNTTFNREIMSRTFTMVTDTKHIEVEQCMYQRNPSAEVFATNQLLVPLKIYGLKII